MSYVIKAVLSNPQRPECGQITIPFPIPVDQYDQTIEMLRAMGLGEPVNQDCKVDVIDSHYSVLGTLEGTRVNVDQLDYLAKRLDGFCSGEDSQFQAMAHKMKMTDIEDFINLTYCCQQATVITDFSDLEAVGRSHFLTVNGGSARMLYFAAYTAYYRFSIYVDLRPDEPVTTFMKTEGKSILMEREGEYVPFEIRGVNMGVGIPGEWATDYAIDKETYLRWFEYIQELGANTVRVYIALQDDFYNAFYEYNTAREALGEEPLWLIHGVWVNDYMQNSHRDAYDEDLLNTLIDDSKTVIDILHGQKVMSLGRGLGSGSYRHDVSRWVLGYILGVEWESTLVTYTNQTSGTLSSYEGEYLYTTEDATPFEAFLCRVGDGVIAYESARYKQQRLVAFSNWPTTDPFSYPVTVAYGREKYACVDVEHIKSKQDFQSGMFVSYHIYPYFPDYLEVMRKGDEFTDAEISRRLGPTIRATLEYRESKLEAPSIRDWLYPSDYYDRQGRYNTYIAYLRAINRYHSLPVVISEYGVSTGRGMAQEDINTGRNQGHMTEQEQGQAIIDCYQDIMDAGCAGSCVFTWQDEWFKRTWNTMHAVDLDKTPYWSDYQTNEQYFGLLTFDPGTLGVRLRQRLGPGAVSGGAVRSGVTGGEG